MKTIGMVVVTACTASAPGMVAAKITAVWRRTSPPPAPAADRIAPPPFGVDGTSSPLDVADLFKPLPKCSKSRSASHRATWFRGPQSPASPAAAPEPRTATPPPRRRAADELATFDHSITSSARASSVAGTSRPSAFAVLRLITSSYLVAA